MTPQQQFEVFLRSHGVSSTAARSAVFQALLNHGPLQMAELVRRVSPATNRASVYRSVALFEQLHIIERITIGWKYKLELSDRFHPHHHHIMCERCGKIEDIANLEALETNLSTLALEHGFELHTHQLELRGICAQCLKST